jgi:hypothetical protein
MPDRTVLSGVGQGAWNGTGTDRADAALSRWAWGIVPAVREAVR